MEKDDAVDKYINCQQNEAREILERIRTIVHELTPEVKEKMGYGIVEFNLNGPLVYIAGFKKHIGLYPTSSGINKFKDELGKYKSGKGSVQFPIDKPIPYDLIKKIVKFRINEN